MGLRKTCVEAESKYATTKKQQKEPNRERNGDISQSSNEINDKN